jgi:uncharacterized protein (TIGR00251 family)
MTAPWKEWQGETLVLSVRVQPRASRDEVVGVQGGRLKIRITAPPVDGAANAHLARFLAGEFGIARSRVEIVTGQAAREKRIAIHGPRSRPGWLEDST